MRVMATKKLYVRTVPEARNALRRVLTKLVERLPDLVTQERLVCASWLWMDGLDDAALARDLQPHLIAMRDRMAQEPEPKAGEPGKVIGEIELEPKPKRRKENGPSGVDAEGEKKGPKPPHVPRRPRR
jgi:hypothetical protein